MNADSKKKQLIASIIIIIAVVLVAFGASAISKEMKEDSSVATDATNSLNATSNTDSSAPTTTATNSASYKDGTYTVDDSYQSPGGNEAIKTSITVEGGVIKEAKVTQHANNSESADHQSDFAKGFKSKVIGKAIGGLNISRVSGASLTTKAFNDAIEQIRTKAQA